jgi:hypothetical protein
MIDRFEVILNRLFGSKTTDSAFTIFDPESQLRSDASGKAEIAQSLNSSFIILLAGRNHPLHEKAKTFLSNIEKRPEWEQAVRFYLKAIESIRTEIETVAARDPRFSKNLDALFEWVSSDDRLKNHKESTDRVWAVFFPEAAGLKLDWAQQAAGLRSRRTVTITELNPTPVDDPLSQIIFTSNVLLTLPSSHKSIDESRLSEEIKTQLRKAMEEPQLYWFDHPIQICSASDQNEVLYGLRELDSAIDFEKSLGTISADSRLTCVLSVSVTHRELEPIAGKCLAADFAHAGGFDHLDVYAFAEADTRNMVKDILSPAADHYLNTKKAGQLLDVIGVDGEYGRHYSFLKAIAAFWQVLIQPEKTATFKIDLDQVFPQKELLEQTGATAFEHFKTDLWGAHGVDAQGREVDLGMIAGALVNEKDIEESIFTPDVGIPERPRLPDEYIFFSQLPQALSTEAEMTTRYNTDQLDGKTGCIQRIHITGGTNGILIDRLFRYRPFTPSFFGRAEDQAYILSVLSQPGSRLAYVHKDGLIMRHDKEAFALEAIKAAQTGKIIGDYLRILYFSAYGRIISEDISSAKDILDPFTGCFISRIPVTVVFLRFALKAASIFASGKESQGVEFITGGARRLLKALEFVRNDTGRMKQQFKRERKAWHLYYDTLSALQKALAENDAFAVSLKHKAEKIVKDCYL